MRIIAIILFCLWALVSARGDENLTLDTKSGKVKKTSSNAGSPTKPINFADVTVAGLSVSGSAVTSLTATAPIIVTPDPIIATGTISIDPTAYQPLDADLTSLAAASGVSSMYYRVSPGTWGLVTIGSNVSFIGGVLSATAPAISANSKLLGSGAGGAGLPAQEITLGTNLSMSGLTLNASGGGGGNVSNTGTPLDNQVAVFTDATHVEGNSNLSFDSSTNILSSGVMSPVTGFRINGAAANRRILVGNATNFVQSTETYAVPGTSGNVMQSDGTNWTSAQQNFSGLAGNWTLSQGPSTTASKLLGRTDASAGIPQEITLGTNLAMSGTTLNATGGSTSFANPTAKVGTAVVNGAASTAMRSDAAPPIDQTINLGMTAAQTVTLTDAITGAVSDVLTIDHESSGTPLTNYGTGLLFRAKDNNFGVQDAGRIAVVWGDPTHSSHRSAMDFQLDVGGSNPSSAMVLYQQSGGGSLSVGSATNPTTTGIINAAVGYWVGNTFSASGKVMQSDGSKFIASAPAWPSAASPAAGKIVQADGTNYIASTPTWPTTAGTAGYTVRSDGTNLAMYPQDILNSSVSSQSVTTSDVYLTNSNVTVAAGDFKAKGQYRCVFDMTKSAGTGTIVITVRVGTGGIVTDASTLTFTFGAGTSVADTGTFEIIATWRTVGSGTSAVMQGICRAQKNAATTTGLWNNAGTDLVIVAATSSGFNSSTATNIGVSFNGNTAFAGTTTLVQASLLQ